MTTEKDHFTLNLTKGKIKKMELNKNNLRYLNDGSVDFEISYQEKLEKAGFEIKYYSTKIMGVINGIEYFITYKNKLSRNYEKEFESSYNKAKKIGLI